MAQAWPSATVIATDLTPPKANGCQSTAHANIVFQKANADDDWNFGPARFDFIHGRMLASGIHDWPGLLEKSFGHLSTGGRLELLDLCHPFRAAVQEFDNPETSPFIHFGQLAERAWTSSGLDYRATTKHVQRLTGLGFTDIKEKSTRWPLGEWASTPRERQIGNLTLQNFLRFIDMAGEALLANIDSFSLTESRDVVRRAKEDLQNNHSQKQFYLMM